MRNALRPLLLTTALLAVSCSGADTITVTITPSATAAINDGQTPTQLVALVTAGGAPAPDGTDVTFSINSSTAASFAPFAVMTAATQQMDVQTQAGNATVDVYDVRDEAVVITISAAITPDDGDNYAITGSASITFGGKCKDAFISAKPTSLQSGVPSSITLTCESQYMGGIFPFDQGTEQLFSGNTQPCSAIVNDASQQGVANAAVVFLTEAGTFETDVIATGQHPTELTDSTGTANVNYQVSAPYPEDVPWSSLDGTLLSAAGGPATVKREWTGTNASGQPHTYNPRDGWVTMIAAVPGIPSAGSLFCNTNADGGCPEPYVDSNDNGQWDLGEPYIDVNCDGQWNAQQTPNAQGLVDIWTSKTIVWTDGVWLASDCDNGTGFCTGSGPLGDAPAGCSKDVKVNTTNCSYVFRWVDKNLNLLSTFLGMEDNGISYTVNSGEINEPTDVQLNVGFLAQSLVQNPDIPVGLIDSADPQDPVSTGSYSLSAAGTFVFGDSTVSANAPLQGVIEQTFTFNITGGCDTN